MGVGLMPCVAFANLSARVEGRHFSSSSWNTGSINNWKEREGVPCRIRFDDGPATDHVITIEFDHSEGDIPLIEDINSFSKSHVVIKSGPTLYAPVGDVWSYTMTVDVTDDEGELRFEARLAAGSHLADRSSFRVSVSGVGTLNIERPDRATGTPDLVVVKTGPATAAPGDVLTYRLECYNKTEAINAADGVQVFDRLPPELTYVPGSANWPVVLVGNTLRIDLGDLQEDEREVITYKARVNETYTFNSEFSNLAQIYSSEDDGDFGDNTSSVRTTLDRAPIRAVDDSYLVNENGALDVPAPGVLANDSGPAGATLLASLASQPQHGWVAFNGDGSFIYMPNAGYTGLDSFTYVISDGVAGSAPATVRIVVGAVDEAPTALTDSYAGDQNTILTVNAPGVLANDSDPDGDPLTAVFVSGPQYGTLQLNADGSFIYTPQPTFHGVDSFSYLATDGSNSSAIATVMLTIREVTSNRPPTGIDDAYATDDRQALIVAAPGVLGNDFDPDGDVLTASLEIVPLHGTLSLDSNGGFVYTPPLNFSGVDTFIYRVSDGQQSALATVAITVTAMPDLPIARDDDYATDEDRMITVNAPGVLANDSDPDGDPLRAIVVTMPANGILTLNSNGSFTYVPRPHSHGVDTFTYRVDDGLLQSGIATVTILVRSVNDRPVVNLDNYETYKNRSIAVHAPGILANDLDFDYDPLTAILVNRPAHGSVTLNDDGSFVYKPNTNFTGADSFTYKASDGITESIATLVSIAVRPFTNNIPPLLEVVRPTNASVFLAPANITVVVEATDLDGDIREVEIFEGTNSLGLLTNAPYFVVHTNLPPGQYAFHARATDDDGASSTSHTVHVTVVDRLPLIETNPIHFNPQTGLFEVAARVTNPTLFPFDAVCVLVYNLTPGVTVWNVSGYTNGIPYVMANHSLAPGASCEFAIECYSPVRVAPACTLVPAPVQQVAPADPRGKIVPVRRVKRLPDANMLIDFNGALNRVHYVQYSDDMVTWKTALPYCIGTGTTMQWLDNGAPKTENHPMTHPTRFYRVIVLP